MCSQYEAVISAKALKAYYGVVAEADMNFPVVRPTHTMPILAGLPTELEPARWGFFLPQPGKADKSVFNAKTETVETSKFFKSYLTGGRCIAPFSAFREGKLRIVPEGGLASFPAIRRKEKDGLWRYTFLTTEPTDFMRPIHHRMPRILNPDEERAWLDPGTDMKIVREIIHGRPEIRLHAEPVPSNPADWGPLFA